MKHIKQALSLLLALCMLAVLAACAQTGGDAPTPTPSAAETPIETPSGAESVSAQSYSATATGYGEITVTLTVEDGVLTGVAVDGAQETAGIGSAAIADELEPALSAKIGTNINSLSFDDIDAVSGATLTSGGVIAAAQGALAQALGSEESAMTPGVYTAKAVGYQDNPGQISHGVLSVSVEVSEDAIVNIDVDFDRDEDGNILEGNGASLTEDKHYADVFQEDENYAYLQTTNYGGFALNILVDRVMEGQTVAVDSVSNATFTSAGFLSAVRDCLEQAGAPARFFLSGERTQTTGEDLSYDVVVVGAGGAGLTAAVSAQKAGANVLLLEKQDFTGGTTASSNAATRVTNSQLFLAATSGLGEDLAGSTDQTELDAYTAARQEDPNAYTSLTWFWYNETLKNNYKGWFDIELINYVAENGGQVVDWLMDEVGVPYSLDGISDLATARSHRPYEVGDDPFGNKKRPLTGVMRAYGLTSALENSFVESGGTLMLKTRATELLTDENGDVVGVVATQTTYDGGTVTETTYNIDAGAVVLATGGLENNSELAAEFTPQIQYTNSLGARAGDTGDGILMAYYDEDVGAAVQFQGYAPTAGQAGLRNTDALKAAGLPTSVSCNTSLKVSLQGNLLDQTGYDQDAGIVSLWDDALYNARFELPTGVWFSLVPAGALSDSARANADAIAEANLQSVYRADTVEELVALLEEDVQMDGEALLATIEAWNASDADAGLKMEGEGPFYAVSIVPSTNGSYGGLKTNNSFQVLRLREDSADYTSTLTIPEGNYIYDGFRTVKYATYDFWSTIDEEAIYEPIGGLYAAGEVATSEFYGTIYPSAGTSIGLGVTMGRTAGLEAAAYALGDSYDYVYVPHSKAIIELAESGDMQGVALGAYYTFTGELTPDAEGLRTLRFTLRPLTGATAESGAVVTVRGDASGAEELSFSPVGSEVLEIAYPMAEGTTSLRVTVDWDGAGEAYQTSVYTLDVSALVPAQNSGANIAPPPA